MIYFAQFIEIENSPIKIGYAVNVDRRLDHLEWNYRTPLALLATMPGGREEEQAIHARFSHLRLGSTEQFRPAPELMEFMGRPILVGTNPEAVEVVPSQAKPMIVQVRGSQAFKDWAERLSKHERLPIAAIVERAMRLYAKHVGFEDSPER